MRSSIFCICLALFIGLPVAADEKSAGQAPPVDAAQAGEASKSRQRLTPEELKAAIERRRAELEGKLKVEQVLLKGTGEKGTEIEISYRIVDVEGYAAHPKTTFIADETSSTMIPLTKLHKLFTPMPAKDAEKVPPARVTLWDSQGAIKPGQPVTVVVAGYGQKHLLPVAGPDYNPNVIRPPSKASSIPAVAGAKLTVHEIRTVANGHMLKVTYSSEGIEKLDTAADRTYIENPETGRKHPLVKVPRIGVLAPKDVEGMNVSYLVIDNAGEKIKPGQQVNVIVSGVRAEKVTVFEEGNK